MSPEERARRRRVALRVDTARSWLAALMGTRRYGPSAIAAASQGKLRPPQVRRPEELGWPRLRVLAETLEGMAADDTEEVLPSPRTETEIPLHPRMVVHRRALRSLRSVSNARQSGERTARPPLVGRDALLEACCALLEPLPTGHCDLHRIVDAPVVIRGVGGSGKTHLAAAIAARAEADGFTVAWIDAERRGAHVLAELHELATHLEAESLSLSGEPWMVVFDGADEPSRVAGLVPSGGSVLLTSRSESWPARFVTMRLPPLDRVAARRVFGIQRPRRDNSFDAVIDALDGLPLALRLAGTVCRRRGLSAEAYLAQLAAQPGAALVEVEDTWDDELGPTTMADQILLALDYEGAKHTHQVALAAALLGRSDIPPVLLGGSLPPPDDLGGLIERRPGGIWMHPVVQMCVRARLRSSVKVTLETLAARLRAMIPVVLTDARQWDPPLAQLAHTEAVATHADRLGVAMAPAASLLNTTAYALARARGHNARALAFYEHALKLWRRHHPPDHPSVATGYNNCGSMCVTLGRYVSAERHLRRAIELRSREPLGTAYALTLGNLGDLLRVLDRHQEAEAALDEAITLRRAQLDVADPDRVHRRRRALAHTLGYLALLRLDQGDPGEAMRLTVEASVLRERSDPDASLIAASHSLLGRCHLAAGAIEPARRALEGALRLWRRALTPHHPLVARTLTHLAAVHRRAGEFVEAERRLMDAGRCWREGGSFDSPRRTDTVIEWGRLHLETGRLADARSSFADAGRLLRDRLEPDHFALVEIDILLGWTACRIDGAAHGLKLLKAAWPRFLDRFGDGHPMADWLALRIALATSGAAPSLRIEPH